MEAIGFFQYNKRNLGELIKKFPVYEQTFAKFEKEATDVRTAEWALKVEEDVKKAQAANHKEMGQIFENYSQGDKDPVEVKK